MPSTSAAFEKARAEDRAALVGYLPAGFPTSTGSHRRPAGDGRGRLRRDRDRPALQRPGDGRAHDPGGRPAGARRRASAPPTCSASSRRSPRTGMPTLVMTYWNPVERYGVERCAADLAAAGGAGLITPDLTPDHGSEWIAAADAHDLDKVFLVAPSSHRRPHRDDRRGLPRLRLRHRGHGRHRRARPPPATSPARSSRGSGRAATSRSPSGSASATATRPPRWRRTPTA